MTVWLGCITWQLEALTFPLQEIQFVEKIKFIHSTPIDWMPTYVQGTGDSVVNKKEGSLSSLILLNTLNNYQLIMIMVSSMKGSNLVLRSGRLLWGQADMSQDKGWGENCRQMKQHKGNLRREEAWQVWGKETVSVQTEGTWRSRERWDGGAGRLFKWWNL